MDKQLRTIGQINKSAIELGFSLVKPGITTKYIDEQIHDFIISHDNCKPAFLGYIDFPASTCISINDEMVHTVPSNYTMLVMHRQYIVFRFNCPSISYYIGFMFAHNRF